jgi:transcriptional regulator with XRE-family HTH domain
MAKKSPNAGDRHVGRRIRMRRTVLSMSQERLGELLGITFQQIQKYEKGTNRIGTGRLINIAEALNVPIVYFFEGYANVASEENAGGDLSQMMTTREGLALARAFAQMTDPSIRQSFVDMAEAIARIKPS